MREFVVLNQDWKHELADSLLRTQKSLIICSPYVTSQGVRFIQAHLPPGVTSSLKLRFLTDLSPLNICQGSTDPAALSSLVSAIPHSRLLHLPKLHAKVYVADDHSAIVTSANLTAAGLNRNYEYGLKVLNLRTVRAIARDITGYSDLGALVSAHHLANYCGIADRVRTTYAKQQRTIRESVRREFEQAVLTAEDELIRMRLAGGARHTVFAKTILYLLSRHGPLSTVQLHPKIQAIHPDLCDDTIDRVIDGKHFGKKWKHAVRTAQQQLKSEAKVFLTGGLWSLTL